jgi:pimeloyl-ACP methyl ester carboxylesterase
VKSNYTSRLSEIQIPVLVVHGAKDIGVPLNYARRAADILPNSRLEVIEGAGHWTQRDYPQLFNRLLLEFLGE